MMLKRKASHELQAALRLPNAQISGGTPSAAPAGSHSP